MQCGSRMEHGDHKTVAHFSHLPMDLGDLRPLEEQAHRKAPQRDDNAWVHDLDLVLKIIAGAYFHFIGQWITVARRAALDHVRDPHIRAGHTRLFEQLVEELPRGAHKRTSRLIFTRARPFTDEHDLGLCGSLAWHSLFTRTMKLALRADLDLLGKPLQFLFIAHFVLPCSTWNAHRQRLAARHSTQTNSSGSRPRRYPGSSAACGRFPHSQIFGTFLVRQNYLHVPPKTSSARLHALCAAGHVTTTVCRSPACDNQDGWPGSQRALRPPTARPRSCRQHFHPDPPPSSVKPGYRSARTGTTVRARAG